LLNATADFTGFPPLPEIKECAAALICSCGSADLERMHHLDIPTGDKDTEGTKRPLLYPIRCRRRYSAAKGYEVQSLV
jgi:hypothetical protein